MPPSNFIMKHIGSKKCPQTDKDKKPDDSSSGPRPRCLSTQCWLQWITYLRGLSVGSQHYRKFLTLSSYSLSPNGPVQCVPTLGLPWGTCLWTITSDNFPLIALLLLLQWRFLLPICRRIAGVHATAPFTTLYIFGHYLPYSMSGQYSITKRWGLPNAHCLPSSVREENPCWPAAETPRGEVRIHKQTPGRVWCAAMLCYGGID